jgi:hypothetical protein
MGEFTMKNIGIIPPGQTRSNTPADSSGNEMEFHVDDYDDKDNKGSARKSHKGGSTDRGHHKGAKKI